MKKDKQIALLIVDPQKSFFPSKKIIEGIYKIAGEYHTVIATQFMNGNPLYKEVLKYPNRKKGELELVTLPKNTRVFQKTGYGLPQKLLLFLKQHAIKKVDVCGFETDACVLASMYDLWDARIRPTLLPKLSSTPNKKIGGEALAIIQRNFGN